jgi:hypothetical protein
MSAWMKGLPAVAALLALSTFCSAAGPVSGGPTLPPATPIYVFANVDYTFPFQNEVDVLLAGGTQLTEQNPVLTGGMGIEGGFFGTTRLNSVPSTTAPCLYVSDAMTNDIATISLPGQQLVGNFFASQADDGSANGISLAVNAHYVYAGFTASNTIATFSQQAGCGLTFLGDIPALGLQGGSVSGMAANANILVVAYGDGSIQSFNVAGGMPVSNNDLQNSSGYNGGLFISSQNMPASVDITQDGRFAIFGDISSATTLEVSNLTSGKLATTVVTVVGTQTVGYGLDAGSVRLSPDQSLIYVTNSESGTVAAAFFTPATGAIKNGCVSPTLQGFNGLPWFGSVVTRDTTGTGNVLYVGEFGRPAAEVDHGFSAIGILSVTSNGKTCTLTEASGSPYLTSYPGLLSISVYPPRPF